MIRKTRLISNTMTTQPGKQSITIHILSNISRIKIKFGQLIEYNMRHIFLKNHTQNMVEKLLPGPFLKNRNGAYLWINSLKFYTVCFHCMPSLEL